MVDNVVNLIEHQPHITGEVKCLACNYEWVGVAPIGTVQFECPECGLEKGQTKYACLPESGSVWTCNCGSRTFFLRNQDFMCTNCGKMSEYNVL